MNSIVSRCPFCKAMNRLPVERIEALPTCGICRKPLLEGKPIEGNSANLGALINSDKPVIVDFWAPWCSPCINFAPVFEQLALEEKDKLRFVKVDTEAQQQIAAQYKIRSIPTLIMFRKGRLIDTINGALPKSQFKQWVAQALNK
ncbi:MAG: thioredoxin 2 [Psychromonas sp.]|jgi:thioredoxin 2|uniref:thioredoxin TrxC n=1 Tax=Psychromonas sp. TaxID=1884585 RepID=UPI0039E63AB9